MEVIEPVSGAIVMPYAVSRLRSAEHENLKAYKYKKYQEIQLFPDSDKPRVLFFLLMNVKMPTIVGILTFMSRKNFMLI